MIRNISSLLVGFLFALGLGISKMTQPEKVIGFLDFFGDWDPSLIFVMIGGIATNMLFYYTAMPKTKTPLLDDIFHIPTKKDINLKLLLGSALFGIGWGLGGFCPGPAMTSMVSLNSDIFIFAASMLVGMRFFSWIENQFAKKS